MEEEEYAPRQYAKDGGITEVDFRSLAKSHDKSSIPNRDPTHASGGKRKRASVEVRRGGQQALGGRRLHAPPAAAPHAVSRRLQADEAEAMPVDADAGAAGAADTDAPLAKRRAYDNVSGKVSQRPWKATFTRASAISGRPPSDWEAKMNEKAQKKAIQACAAPLCVRLPEHELR